MDDGYAVRQQDSISCPRPCPSPKSVIPAEDFFSDSRRQNSARLRHLSAKALAAAEGYGGPAEGMDRK